MIVLVLLNTGNNKFTDFIHVVNSELTDFIYVVNSESTRAN